MVPAGGLQGYRNIYDPTEPDVQLPVWGDEEGECELQFLCLCTLDHKSLDEVESEMYETRKVMCNVKKWRWCACPGLGR